MCQSQQNISTLRFVHLVKIGQEKAPLYCSKYNIYIAFEFDATASQEMMVDARESDKLQDVTLFPWTEECLCEM